MTARLKVAWIGGWTFEKPKTALASGTTTRHEGAGHNALQPAESVERKVSALVNLLVWISCCAVHGLGSLPGQLWLRPAKAKLLIALDRAAGGRSQVTKKQSSNDHGNRNGGLMNVHADILFLTDKGAPFARLVIQHSQPIAKVGAKVFRC